MAEPCSCGEIKSILDEFRTELMESLPKGRAKRPPSEWQIFLKTCIPTKTGAFTEKIRACSVDYKKR